MATHSLVRWEDDVNQYAVVDNKRSKSVSTLKVGVTTCFEGYERERRRGTILFLGSKKDCSMYGLDIASDDGQINLSQWSSPPGLREQAEEVNQMIRQGASGFKRTVSNMSSSSSASSTTMKTQQKKKNVNNNNPIDDESINKENTMPPPQSASTITICETFDSPDDRTEQSSSSNKQQSFSTTAKVVSTVSTASTTTSSIDSNALLEEIKDLREKLSSMDSLEEENKKLREKVLSLEDELSYVQSTAMRVPEETTVNYLKSIVDTYEQRKAGMNPKLVALEKKLPCTKMELEMAKCNTNSSRTINNLIKFCYKGVDLREQSYTKLKALDSKLMKNIYDYVQYIHAPKVIKQSEFSAAVSLRCRHLREQ